MLEHYLFETTVGWIAIIFKDEKVVGVQFAGKKENSALKNTAQRWKSVSADKPAKWVIDLSKRMMKHLAGETQHFGDVILDLEGMTPFRKKVYKNAMKIKPGRVMTYGQLAEISGSPGAARAVGSAMARNPFLILMPCHRVVGSNGKMHGFSAIGGIKTKEKLLTIEGAI